MLSLDELLKMETVYKITETKKTIINKNICYKTTNNNDLLMDLYTQHSKQNKKLPVVIFIHGEASKVNFKEAGQYTSYGKLIASLGINAITFNHRVLSDGGTIEEIFEDIKDLIDYLILNEDTLQLDMNKVILWSFSAGVPFGLYIGMKDYGERIKGLITYYGFSDFISLQKCFGFNLSKESITKYSPIEILNKKENHNVPLFIAKAGLDNPIINNSIDEFVLAALKNNVNIDLYNHPSGGHCFDLFTNNERSIEIIKKSLDFIMKCVR